MRFLTGGATTQGLREYQQDAHACLEMCGKGILFVADGNGKLGRECANVGMEAGISHLAIEFAKGRHCHIEDEEHLMALGKDTLRKAAERVRAFKMLRQMEDGGTTLTLVLVAPPLLATCWVGDSPVFAYQDNKLLKMTTPVHTLAEMLIAEGQPREHVASQRGVHSILTRCAGYEDAEPDGMVVRMQLPCFVIAGSDGALNFMTEEELGQEIRRRIAHHLDLEAFANDLIARALQNGSDDNCTIALGMAIPSEKPRQESYRLTHILEYAKGGI